MKQFLLFVFCIVVSHVFPATSPVEPVTGQPVILSVSPNSVTQGDTVNFIVIGQYTHFTQGAAAQLHTTSTSPIQPLSQQVINDTMAIFRYVMYYQIAPDSMTFCIGNSLENVCKSIHLLPGPYPPSFTITPNSAIQGETVQITIKGSNTHFKHYTGSNAIILFHTQKNTNQLLPMEYINDSLLKVTVTMDYRDNAGTYDFLVNDAWPAPAYKLPGGFTLHAGLYPPKLLPCSPDTVSQGDHVTIRISGRNTHFLTGPTVISLFTVSLGNIQPSATHILNDSTIDADFAFTYNTVPGTYTLHYENHQKDGYLPLPNAVTVKAGTTPPALKSISPAFARKDQSIRIRVIGNHTSFTSNDVVTLSNPYGHIIADSVEWISDTLLIARFTFSGSDSVGKYNLVIPKSNNSPSLVLMNCFTLYPAGSTILSISPSAASIGDSIQLVVNTLNAHYLSNSNTVWLKSIYGGNLLYGKQVVVMNDSMLKASFVFSDSLLIGKYNVFVSNSTDHTAKLDSTFLLKNDAQNPRIIKVDPHVIMYQSTATITLKAKGTHFQQGVDSIRLNQWTYNLFPISMQILSDTVITATFKFPALWNLPLKNNAYLDIVVWGKNRIALPYGIILFQPVPVPEVEKQTVLIYPNPSTGMFYVLQGKDHPVKELQVLDVSGKTILHLQQLTEQVELNLSSQPAGVYYMRLLGDTIFRTEKLIKLE